MVQRSRTSAKTWCVANRAGHEMLRQWNRLVQRSAERQVRRQRRGKGASGSVCVTPGDPRRRVVCEDLSVVHKVDDLLGIDVTPGDDDVDRAERPDTARRFASILFGSDRDAGQQLRLRNVRSHDVRAADQFSFHRHESFVIEQRFAAGRHDHGSTTRNGISRFNRGGNRLDDCRIGEHAGLGGVNANVRHDGFDLRSDEVGSERRRRRDAQRVLSGDGGHGGRTEYAMRRKCLEVGLYPCAGARIASGDGERRPQRLPAKDEQVLKRKVLA